MDFLRSLLCGLFIKIIFFPKNQILTVNLEYSDTKTNHHELALKKSSIEIPGGQNPQSLIPYLKFKKIINGFLQIKSAKV